MRAILLSLACGVLVPRPGIPGIPGIQPAPPALEGEVLTPGLPGRSRKQLLS